MTDIAVWVSVSGIECIIYFFCRFYWQQRPSSPDWRRRWWNAKTLNKNTPPPECPFLVLWGQLIIHWWVGTNWNTSSIFKRAIIVPPFKHQFRLHAKVIKFSFFVVLYNSNLLLPTWNTAFYIVEYIWNTCILKYINNKNWLYFFCILFMYSLFYLLKIYQM